ncbi:pro-thyrotropin-releasing hormone [Oryzias melastigma]|uniref:Thyrotropin-releasing hormone n=1 Tax=Oryzias melastigma TaxID=30732 RepID=A0A3B3BSR8_ORYME|nr:pro-thyrotropin-releasing hormone [Oryzias melastigma]
MEGWEVVRSYLKTWPSGSQTAVRLKEKNLYWRCEGLGARRIQILLRRTTIIMKSVCLFILASLAICNFTVSEAQSISAEDETDRTTTIDDMILRRAESLLLRSLLKKMQDEDDTNDGVFSQQDWIAKRQHPGKRYREDLEKRQHPCKREEDEDEQFLDVQKRQHPGKREDEIHSIMGLQKRQHPGKRFLAGHISDNPIILLSELSKRQHPGKRYLVLHSKRQHPGKRYQDDEDSDGDWETTEEEDLPELEKRQHPGKRLWDNSNPEMGNPCDALEPGNCSKTNMLLDFLDNINKGHEEEKRQHPGKRFALKESEEDAMESE